MQRAVIYARYSAGPNQTDQSIEGQLRVCKNYIDQKGFTYIGHYADKHISGKTDRRPEFQQMINDAETGAFDVLVVYSTDRFSRSKYDSAIYKKKLHDLGIQICYAAENIPDGPEGILMEALMEGWAQYYSEELSRKIRRGLHDAATKAKYLGSYPPIGYKVTEDRHFEIDEEIAPYIVQVFQKYLDGYTFAELGRFLASKGFRTRSGNVYGNNSMRRMLENKRYIGTYMNGDVEIPDGMPRIVSDDLFNAVQYKLKQKERPKVRRGDYDLSGKLYCAKCGESMTGISGTSKTGEIHYYYKCKNKCRRNINRDKLEAFVVDQVQESFMDPFELDKLAKKIFDLHEKERAPEAEYELLKKRLAGLDTKIDNTVDAIADGLGSKALMKKLQTLEDQKEDLEAQLAAAEIKKRPTLSLEAIRSGLEAFLHGFYFDNEKATRKRILEAFVHQVELADNWLAIEFNILDQGSSKTSGLIEFDQADTWWSSCKSGRTLVPTKRGFAVLCRHDF